MRQRETEVRENIAGLTAAIFTHDRIEEFRDALSAQHGHVEILREITLAAIAVSCEDIDWGPVDWYLFLDSLADRIICEAIEQGAFPQQKPLFALIKAAAETAR